MTARKKAGRPAHKPTEETRKMVTALAGFSIPQETISQVLDISRNTLMKHYRTELRHGEAKVEAQLVGNLLRIASGNSGHALKAIMFALNCRFGWSQYAPPPPTRTPIGKKEQAVIDAEEAHEDSSWGSLLH